MRRIAFITDLHLDEPDPLGIKVTPNENLEVVLAHLAQKNITEVIFGGDIGNSSSHAYFFEKFKPYKLNLVLGNHDHFEEVSKHYKQTEANKELYYQFEDETFRYLFLDSSSDSISDIQLIWLQQQLQTTKKLLLFVHHPILPIDTPADKHFPLKNRDSIKDILVGHEKEITIFCGHYHMNHGSDHANIQQFVTPSLCFQLEKNAAELQVDTSIFGYRLIELSDENIQSSVITFYTKD